MNTILIRHGRLCKQGPWIKDMHKIHLKQSRCHLYNCMRPSVGIIHFRDIITTTWFAEYNLQELSHDKGVKSPNANLLLLWYLTPRTLRSHCRFHDTQQRNPEQKEALSNEVVRLYWHRHWWWKELHATEELLRFLDKKVCSLDTIWRVKWITFHMSGNFPCY